MKRRSNSASKPLRRYFSQWESAIFDQWIFEWHVPPCLGDRRWLGIEQTEVGSPLTAHRPQLEAAINGECCWVTRRKKEFSIGKQGRNDQKCRADAESGSGDKKKGPVFTARNLELPSSAKNGCHSPVSPQIAPIETTPGEEMVEESYLGPRRNGRQAVAMIGQAANACYEMT